MAMILLGPQEERLMTNWVTSVTAGSSEFAATEWTYFVIKMCLCDYVGMKENEEFCLVEYNAV